MPLLAAEGMSLDKAHKYQSDFNQQQISQSIAVQLTRADLKDLGIPFGDLFLMEKAFKKLKITK